MRALSKHCREMSKIAQQAQLPLEATNQLEAMRKTLSDLQAKTLLNPSQSPKLLHETLGNVSEKLSNVVATYFTAGNSVLLEEKNTQDETSNSDTTVGSYISVYLQALVKQMQKNRASLKKDSLLRNNIKKLESSLSQKDSEGYYAYLSDDQETEISINLKALANTFIALEKLKALYSNTSDPIARSQALKYGKKAWEHFRKIHWEQLDKSISDEDKDLINSMLAQGIKIISPAMKSMIDASHQVELENHLRFGIILDELQPVLDGMNQVIIARGLKESFDPISFDANEENDLNLKLHQARISQAQVSDDHEKVTKTSWIGM